MATLPQSSPLDDVLRRLIVRGLRTLLHRLHGLRTLLGGWVEVGVPPGSETRVASMLQEDAALLARLDWVGTLLVYPPPLERMEAGDAPAFLFAIALGLGSPEEARARLPVILDRRSAVAAALWLQLVAPDGVLDHDLHLRWEGRSLVLEVERDPAGELAAWDGAFGELLLAPREARRIAFRPGGFAPKAAEGEIEQAG